MYEWNVRIVRTTYKYAEFIVKAKTQQEAEELLNPDTLEEGTTYNDVVDEEHWSEVEEETYIHGDYTERMDVLFPEDYNNDGEHE